MTARGQRQERRLAELTALAGGGAEALEEGVRAALRERYYRLVAKAAELAAERLLYGLEEDLMGAYERFLEDPVKSDPQCAAKTAIARALVALDAQEAEFYVRGLRYTQHEPVWGGSVDTAVDLRCVCAGGLVTTPYPRALIDLVELLEDPEAQARIGALRAIACLPAFQAEALLRFKALSGDPESGVVGECLRALLQVEPDESPAFVARYLGDARDEVRELAALALGESRLEPALAWLQAAWDETLRWGPFRQALLRAVVLHRSAASLEWLLSLVEEAAVPTAARVIEELALYRSNARLSGRLREAVERRADPALREALGRAWGGEP